jgi:broad specificity phosphatase PhoE
MTGMIETRWWWVRHAPVPNPERRCYGQQDMDADCTELAHFRALASRLPTDAVWIATPLRRTQLTAHAIHAACEPAREAPRLTLEQGLVEQHFGDWQGLTYAEIGAFGHGNSANTGHRFWLAPAHTAVPGGESFVEVMERVATSVLRLTREHAGKDIVCVAHGGSIRAAIALALNLDPEAALALSIDNLSLTRLDNIDGPGHGHGWRVGSVNLPPL